MTNKKEIITMYSQELVGFYYGLPSKQNNIEYYRDLVAEFDW